MGDRIRKTYLVLRSIRKTAKVIGVSYGTIRRSLIDSGGVPDFSERRPPTRSASVEGYSRISEWLNRHKGKAIPSRYRELSVAIGQSSNAIKCYFYRQRKAILDKLKILPDIRDERIALTDIDGKTLIGSQLTSYEYRVGNYPFDVTVIALAKDGEYHVFPIPDSKAFRVKVKALLT
jgi:hypothetical protein